MAWDKTKIAEGVLAPDLNDEIRANWADLEAALTKEHLFSTGETPDSNQGHHRQGSARCFWQATAPGTRINGDAFTSIDNGSVWIDSDNKKVYILTATDPTWTLISTEVIATMVAAAHTWAAIQTFSLASVFSISPSFTKGIVANAVWLAGRNAAGGANVNLIRVNSSDVPELKAGMALESTHNVNSNNKVANKKYVDDTPHTGGIVQVVNAQTGEVATGTTTIPHDNTIPQNTEGDEYMTLAITPTNANNKLKIEVAVFIDSTASNKRSAALFQDAIANALAAGNRFANAYEPTSIAFTHYMTAGTTSTTTFKVRVGGESGTISFNGTNGVRRMGGVMASSITITEIKV